MIIDSFIYIYIKVGCGWFQRWALTSEAVMGKKRNDGKNEEFVGRKWVYKSGESGNIV